MYENVSEIYSLAPFLTSYGPFVLPMLAAYLTILYLFSHAINVVKQTAGKGFSLFGFKQARRNFKAVPQTHPVNSHDEQVPYKPTTYSDSEMVSRSRDFYETINGRRSVRFFSDRPVPEEVIENIIKSAGKECSNFNT